MSEKKDQRRPKALKTSLIQAAFVDRYTAEGTDTFANGTASMVAIRPEVKRVTARSLAAKLTANDSVKEDIGKAIERHRVSVEARIGVLADVVHDNVQAKTESTYRDEDGNVVSSVETVKGASVKDRLGAIDLLNKLSGEYQKAEVAKHVAVKEIDQLYQQHIRDLSTDTVQ